MIQKPFPLLTKNQIEHERKNLKFNFSKNKNLKASSGNSEALRTTTCRSLVRLATSTSPAARQRSRPRSAAFSRRRPRSSWSSSKATWEKRRRFASNHFVWHFHYKKIERSKEVVFAQFCLFHKPLLSLLGFI